MAAVYRAIKNHPKLDAVFVSTGQHTDLLRTALEAFGLKPDHELHVMTPAQSLAATAAKILERFTTLIETIKPAAVLVQGDTTTALSAGMAAYYSKIPVGHVEAGLRTYDLDNPFPEEANRQMVDRISRWCFPPTEESKQHLLAELISASSIHVTGNTGIDGLLWALDRAKPSPAEEQFVLMTMHRRESFGEPLRDILLGLLDFLSVHPEAKVVWPVHPNPAVGEIAKDVLKGNQNISMIPPQEYLSFAGLLATCKIILTDSGGIQEEAPSLGKRVLIARDTTERPEAVKTGQNRLIGRQRKNVGQELIKAWQEPIYTGPQPAPNPYGDGNASLKIAEILAKDLFKN